MNPAKNRLLITINSELKNSYNLTDGVTIVLLRDEMQFDCRIKNAVQGFIYGTTTEVLIDHNSHHRINEVLDHDILLPEHTGIYSISNYEIYAYRHEDSEGWLPHTWEDDDGEHGFLLVERIWEPYNGILVGIGPKMIKNRLFVTEGNYKHNVLITENHCDYTIVYQERNGREASLTRMRDNEFEVVGIDEELTMKVHSGVLLIGETQNKAKKFEDDVYAETDNLW